MSQEKPDPEEIKLSIDQWSTMWNKLIESAVDIVKLFFIMNSGAILSLLTFVGNKGNSTHFKELYWSFVWFLVGTFSAPICYVFEFVRQDYSLGTFNKKWNAHFDKKPLDEKFLKCRKRLDWWLTFVARLLALLSLSAFIWGTYQTLEVMSKIS